VNRRIYLASSWRNAYQPQLVATLRAWGHEVYDFRNPWPGQQDFAWRQASDKPASTWSAAETREILLTHPRCAQGYMADSRAMEWADTCILRAPCGRSAHMELGRMKGAGKFCIYYMEDGQEPELMSLMADAHVISDEELYAVLGQRN
jgi:hypothetical protein